MNEALTGERRLSVTIGSARYSLPVAEVESVVSLRRGAISPVPYDTSGRLRGLFSYKGGVVALVSNAALTAQSDADGRQTLTAVILRDGGRRFALLVDRANAVAETMDARTRPLSAHALYAGDGSDDD